MHITGCNYRFLKLLSKLNDLPVYLLQIFFGTDHIMLIICYHKSVISNRLDLQIIIEIYQSGYLSIRCISQNCLIQFPCFTGTSHQKSVSVLLQHTFGNTWTSVIILQVRLTH